MALKPCKECGAEVSTKAKACPKCGAKVPHTKWWLWVPLGLMAAFLGIALVMGSSPEAQAKAADRRAIELCESDGARKSLSDGSKRFIAGACEKMAADFRRKYGVNP